MLGGHSPWLVRSTRDPRDPCEPELIDLPDIAVEYAQLLGQPPRALYAGARFAGELLPLPILLKRLPLLCR